MTRQPTAEEWDAILAAFEGIVDLPENMQEAAVAATGLLPFEAGQLRRLLAASRSTGVLDRQFPASQPDPDNYASIAPGTRIGRFRVDNLIGRGGAGEVYYAERAAGGFGQHVALKLLRAEAIDRFASFDFERKLLASLDHPGIARLIDGGTAPDGRPYMALEYVPGATIIDWCAEHDASLETRLKLFVDVCDAVAYAHSKLIVHRDLKPSNILIDTGGRARLLDFGIAKLIDEATLDRALTGHAMLTPDYAAPEQLENGTTTAATDIYALGAVLFELLTGNRPWQTGGAHVPSLLRRILDEDVPVPSRVATASSPIAPSRIRGDLDAVILKAMRRNPDQRYISVGELAEDLRRHLSSMPVKARQGSTPYYLGRFIHRHRWAAAVTIAAIAAILIGAAGIAWQARNTAIERDAARAEAGQLKALNDAMQLMFRDATGTTRQRSMSVREMIEGTTRRMIRTLPPDSPNAAQTVTALADLYLGMENNDDAKVLLTQALKRGIGRSDPVNAARFRLKLGTILATEGRFADAERMLASADRTWSSDSVRFRRERVETAGAKALILRRTNRPNAATAVLMDNLVDAEENYVNDDRNLAARYASIVTLMLDTDHFAEAHNLLSRADATLTQTAHPHSEGALNLHRLSAELMIRQGQTAAAADIFRLLIADRRRYFGPGIALAVDLLRFARLFNQVGKPAKALTLLSAAAPMAIEHFGEADKTTLLVRAAQIEALIDLDRLTEARALAEKVANPEQHLDSDTLALARYRRSRAALTFALGDPTAARNILITADDAAAKLGKGSREYFLRETLPIRRRLSRA
ncbi:serine/threonine-protein kinase [Sphingomonas immobilis]|uniref:Serine/threonine-protein kinase n=1 Tax=Sphingomonas immobilis TaxID=3063997 RepID=A0ABT8ZX95_9SPHN|nr:serine/threonine-protein kinase [Sphingomonas sp. CA1-15]MDO7841847.1 serine/threonine-protein kinase [Sphingomonas sp. CA1-15]